MREQREEVGCCTVVVYTTIQIGLLVSDRALVLLLPSLPLSKHILALNTALCC